MVLWRKDDFKNRAEELLDSRLLSTVGADRGERSSDVAMKLSAVCNKTKGLKWNLDLSLFV